MLLFWVHQVKPFVQRISMAGALVGVALLLLMADPSLAQTLSCRQAHRLPDWVMRSLSAEQIYKAGRIMSNTVNNEAEGYYLLKNLPRGGFHLGLGGDFNYTLMGEVRSSGGVIYDFDPSVIIFHHLLRAAFLTAETPSVFRGIFMNIRYGRLSQEMFNRLLTHLGPGFWKNKIIDFSNNSDLSFHMQQMLNAKDEHGQAYTYLGDPAKYAHVRQLFLEDKIRFELKSHYEAHALKTMTQDLGATSFSTIYISNSLEFRWLDPMMTHPQEAETIFHGFRGDKNKIGHEAVIKVYDEIEADTQMNAWTKRTQLQATVPVLESFKRGQAYWQQFWQNLSEISWQDDAVMLTTSREWSLFGDAYSRVETYRSPGRFQWIYASLPKKLWMGADLPGAAARFYEKITSRYEQLLNGRKEPDARDNTTEKPSLSISTSPHSSWPYKR